MLVDLQTAEYIKSKINKKKIVLYTENMDHIFGTHYVKYLYADNEIKNKHIEKMMKDDWIYTEYSQSNEGIYIDVYSDGDKDIYLPCAIFEMKIDNINGVKEREC